jgi:hypothetical protein
MKTKSESLFKDAAYPHIKSSSRTLGDYEVFSMVARRLSLPTLALLVWQSGEREKVRKSSTRATISSQSLRTTLPASWVQARAASGPK